MEKMINKMNEYSLKRLYKDINNKKIVLPAWQREFVWSTNQIEKLFDSIYHGYPFGNIMLWETSKDSDIFYEFLNNINYLTKKKTDTNIAVINYLDREHVYAVLDGQQRITTLINVLFTDRIMIKDNNYSLFFNDKQEKFKLLKVDKDDKTDWYKVKDLFENKNLNGKNNRKVSKTLQSIRISPILFKGKIDDALEVFRRLNTSGTKLSNPEINISIIINKGKNFNIREIIETKRKKILKNYHIDLPLPFFVKAIVVCILDSVKYDENKVKDNVRLIQKNYKVLFECIENVCSFCYKNLHIHRVIKSYNMLVPLVYYCYSNKCRLNSNISSGTKYYISICSIYGVFGGQSDNTLLKFKKYVDKKKKDSFTLKNIKKELEIITSHRIDIDEINKMIKHQYCEDQTNAVLYLIYSRNKNFVYSDEFQQDHMHPKKYFSDIVLNGEEYKNSKYIFLIEEGMTRRDIKEIVTNKYWNKIPNLQLLLETENVSGKHSMAFDEWLYSDYKKRIDSTMPIRKKREFYKIANFIKFYKEREKILRNELKDILIKNKI